MSQRYYQTQAKRRSPASLVINIITALGWILIGGIMLDATFNSGFLLRSLLLANWMGRIWTLF